MSSSPQNCSIQICSDVANGIFKQCYDDAICDCHNIYGWVGEECNETSFPLIFQRITSICYILWSLFLIIVTVRTLIANFILGHNPVKGVNSVVYSAIFELLGILGLLTFLVYQLYSLYDPTRFEIVVFDTVASTRQQIMIYKVEFFTSALQFPVICVGCSATFLARSLEGVLVVFFLQDNSKTCKLCKSDLVLFVSLLALIIFIIALNPMEYFLGSALMATLLFFVNSLHFFIRCCTFARVMNNMIPPNQVSYKNSPVRLTVRLIKKLSIVCSVCLASMLFLLVATSAQLGEQQLPGKLNLTALFRDLSLFFTLIYFSYIAWYYNSTTEGIIIFEDYALARLFSRWDSMNKKIFPI